MALKYKHLATNKSIRSLLPIYIHSYSPSFLQRKTNYNGDVPLNHIILVLKGTGETVFNGQSTLLTKGKILFYRAYNPISYYPLSDDFTTCFLTFYGNCAKNLLDYFNYPDYLVFENAKIGDALLKICNDAEKGTKEEEEIIAELYTLITSLGLSINRSQTPKSFEKALYYINKNYYKDIPIDEIAKYAGISRSMLFRQFHDIKHTTVINYINSLRVDWAIHFLTSNPSLSISHISETVGFSSTSYFIKCFKKFKHETPLQYRNRHLK